MSSSPACLLLDYPSAMGTSYLNFGFQSAGFSVDQVWIEDLFQYPIEQEQLSLQYKALVFPNIETTQARWLSLQIENRLKWNLRRFVERGGIVLACGAASDSLIALGLFGEHLAVLRETNPFNEEKWINLIPTGGRCEWLKGVGALNLPMNPEYPELVAATSHHVEVFGRLERLGMACLKSDEGKIMGLCDPTGRIFTCFAQPEFALLANSTRLPRLSGPSKVLFDNAFRLVQG